MIKRFLSDSRGATAIEYGLIVGLISLAILGGVGTAGTAIETLWGNNTTGIIGGLTR